MTRQYPEPRRGRGRGRGRGAGGRVATPAAVRVPTTRTLRSQSQSSARSGSSDSGSASPSPQKSSRIITRRESPLSPSSFEVERTRARSPSSSPSPKRAKSSRGKRGGGSVPRGIAKRGRASASKYDGVSPLSKTARVAQKKKTPTKKPAASPKKVGRKAPPSRDDSVSSLDSRASKDAAVSPVSKTARVAQKKKTPTKKKKPTASSKKVVRKALPARDDSVSSLDSRASKDAAVSPVSKTARVAQKEKTPTKKPAASPKKVVRKAPLSRDDSVPSLDSRASKSHTGNRSPPRARVSVAPGRASVAAGRTSVVVVTNRPGPASKTGRVSMTARTPKEKTPTNKTKRQLDTPVFQKRFRPPPKSILDIQFYQRSTDSLIPLLSFSRLVKEITVEMTNQPDLRWKMSALEALQAASEGYLIGLFEDSNLITMHSRRVTLYPKDLRLAHRIRGDNYRY